MSKIYLIKVGGQEDTKVDGPGQAAKAVEPFLLKKLKGRDNLKKKLAQLERGATFSPEAGISITLLAQSPEDEDEGVFDEDEDEDEETPPPAPVQPSPVEPEPAEPVPPVSEETTTPTVPGGAGDEGPRE